MITHGALVAIIAVRCIGQVLAKALLVAGIVGAGIPIVAIYLWA
jgi:ABC-type transporter Mla maintaining outer membrane lipid asymmetry permease subunit MlaE